MGMWIHLRVREYYRLALYFIGVNFGCVGRVGEPLQGCQLGMEFDVKYE